MAATKPGGAKGVPSFIIVGGDKGGVGKSVTALALVDYLDSLGRKVVLIESDISNADTARMYEGTLPCYFTDLTLESGWMEMMDAVASNPGATFVLSTKAGAGSDMKKYLPSFATFLTRQKTPVGLDLWWPMSPTHDPVNLLNEAMKNHGHLFQKVCVVLNMHFAGDDKREKFDPWNESELRVKLEKQGGITLYLEALHLRVTGKLFNPKLIMPFADAADAALGEKVGLTESERFKLADWREKQFEHFARAFASAPAPTEIKGATAPV